MEKTYSILAALTELLVCAAGTVGLIFATCMLL